MQAEVSRSSNSSHRIQADAQSENHPLRRKTPAEVQRSSAIRCGMLQEMFLRSPKEFIVNASHVARSVLQHGSTSRPHTPHETEGPPPF